MQPLAKIPLGALSFEMHDLINHSFVYILASIFKVRRVSAAAPNWRFVSGTRGAEQ